MCLLYYFQPTIINSIFILFLSTHFLFFTPFKPFSYAWHCHPFLGLENQGDNFLPKYKKMPSSIKFDDGKIASYSLKKSPENSFFFGRKYENWYKMKFFCRLNFFCLVTVAEGAWVKMGSCEKILVEKHSSSSSQIISWENCWLISNKWCEEELEQQEKKFFISPINTLNVSQSPASGILSLSSTTVIYIIFI